MGRHIRGIKSLRLGWSEFDAAVGTIAAAARSEGPSGVFGVPRGGLPLAVALSHALDIPLAKGIGARTLIVDDVIESGVTLSDFAPYSQFDSQLVWVWVAKGCGRREVKFRSVLVVPKRAWVVFPWERADRAEADAAQYYQSFG